MFMLLILLLADVDAAAVEAVGCVSGRRIMRPAFIRRDNDGPGSGDGTCGGTCGGDGLWTARPEVEENLWCMETVHFSFLFSVAYI